MKLGSAARGGTATGGGGGAAGAGGGAGTSAGVDAGADAASAAGGASAGALATGAGAGAAGAATAGVSGATGVAGTTGLFTATPAAALAEGAGVVPAPAAADAAPSLFRSVMFLDNSAIRVAASPACLSLATFSSAAFCPCSDPFESVSLSGAAVAAFRSSTRVCTVPVAERWAAATSVEGAAPASLRRNSLKSRAWAARIWRASGAGVAWAAAWSGICSTAPALRRFTLPWMNASGLARIMATSIWSRETSAGR